MSDEYIQSIRNKINSDLVATVFGSSVAGDNLFTDHTQQSDQDWLSFSKILAHSGIPIINGGYQGTMSLIANRIHKDGGDCFGVVSSSFEDECTHHLFKELFTVNNAFDRLKALISTGNMYIFLPGGIGSVVEIVCTLWYIDRGFMEEKPLYFLGEYWDGFISSLLEKKLMFKNIQTSSNLHQFSDISSFNRELERFILSARRKKIAS